MAGELKKAFQLAIDAYVRQTGRSGNIHPGELIKPMIEVLGETLAGIKCDRCRIFFTANVVGTFLLPFGRTIEVAQEIVDHVKPMSVDPDGDSLATVEPAGHA